MSKVDTLKIYQRLKNAQLPEPAAREIADVLKDTIEQTAISRGDLKGEFTDFRSEMAGQLATFKSEMSGQMSTFKSEMSEQMSTFKSEMSEQMSTFKSEMSDQMGTFRAEMSEQIGLSRADIRTTEGSLQLKIAESKAETLRWVAGMMIAQGGLVAAVVKLL